VYRKRRNGHHRREEGLTAIDENALRNDEELLEIFKAVSMVFPDDPTPVDALERYRALRRALDEAETQLERSGAFSGKHSSREHHRIYRRALKLFEAEVRLSRKQKRARMALSHDWSGMALYVRQGIAIWKFRIILQFGALFLRFGFPRFSAICQTAAYQGSASTPALSIIGRRRLVGHSDFQYSLERRGVAITRDRPSTPIRTGSLTLDNALRIGGFPRGRIVEIFGKEGVGKTTLALTGAANAQREGGRIAYFDNEYKLDFSWARTLGVNVDDALILRGVRAKGTIDSLLEIIRSGDFALVVVDTVAAFFPDEHLESSDSQFNGEMELLVARALPRIASAAGNTLACVLLLNQIRRNDEEVFGKPTVSPGGHALHHCSSIRLELTKTISEKRGRDIVIGSRVKGTVVKNCVGPPWGTAEWAINFQHGLDITFELVEQGLRRGLIDRRTAALRFRDQDLGANNEAARDFLRDHPELAATLEMQLRTTMKHMAATG
jgi:recombination protein RecA